MTLSRKQFNEQSIEFVKLCQGYGDTWYLMAQRKNGHFEELSPEESTEYDGSFEELILTKTEIRRCNDKERICLYEYSVIYNESYEVPVMHFSVSDQAGCPIEVEKVIGLKSKDLSRVVSQVEHPLLFRPFYMIHPCRTEGFMETHHSDNKASYLISWLSVLSTLINLNLDHRLSVSCQT